MLFSPIYALFLAGNSVDIITLMHSNFLPFNSWGSKTYSKRCHTLWYDYYFIASFLMVTLELYVICCNQGDCKQFTNIYSTSFDHGNMPKDNKINLLSPFDQWGTANAIFIQIGCMLYWVTVTLGWKEMVKDCHRRF